MSRQYRIPVTVIASTTVTAYMVFNIEGNDPEEWNANIAKLGTMEADELNEHVDFDIKPIHNFDKHPPINNKVAVAHIDEAELLQCSG